MQISQPATTCLTCILLCAMACAELYGELCRDIAGLPVVVGRRPASGTLSGAAASYTVEAMVGAGRALQVGRSAPLCKWACVDACIGGWWPADHPHVTSRMVR